MNKKKITDNLQIKNTVNDNDRKEKKISLQIKKIDGGTATSNGAIWEEFSEQHQHQIIKITLFW